MQRLRLFLFTLVLACALGAIACVSDVGPDPNLRKESAALSVGPVAAVEFPDGFGIHGIDATSHLWFAAVALPPSVHVARRLTGTVLGTLPPPPEGFGAPVAVRVAPDGRVLVLDGVVAPQAAGTAPAKLFEYVVTPTWSGFTATLIATRVLPLIPFSEIPLAFGPEPLPPFSGIFFPIMMTVLPDGAVAISDTVTGAIWLSNAARTTYHNALQAPQLRPLPQLSPILGKGRAPGGGTRDYALQLTTGAYPGVFGVAYLAATNELTIANPSGPVLWGVSYATFASSASPTSKAASLRPLSAPVLGVTDLVAGIDTNRWDARDPWVYFQRVAADAAADHKNVMARVHGITGAVEVLARDSQVFDFDVAVSVVQPLLPGLRLATIGSGVGQEENNPSVNAILGGVGTFVAPTPIGVVFANF